MVCHAGRADLENNGCPVRPFPEEREDVYSTEIRHLNGLMRYLSCRVFTSAHIHIFKALFFFFFGEISKMFFRLMKSISSLVLRHLFAKPRLRGKSLNSEITYCTTDLYNLSYFPTHTVWHCYCMCTALVLVSLL